MQVVIDQFSEDCAIVELPDRKTALLPRSLIPIEAIVGDILEIHVLVEETKKKRNEIIIRINDLFE